MIRKVIFPLKVKIILLLTNLLVAALSYFVYFAVNLYKADKSASIYSSLMAVNSGLARSTQQWAKPYILALESLANEQNEISKDSYDAIWRFLPDVLQARAVEINGSQRKLIYTYDRNSKYAQEEQHLDYFIEKNSQELISDSSPWKLNLIKGMQGVLSFQKGKRFYFLRILFNGPMQLLDHRGPFKMFFLNKKMEVMGSDIEKFSSDFRQALAPLIQDDQSGSDHVKVIEAKDGQRYLTAIGQMQKIPLIAISLLEEDKAFAAAKTLVTQSMIYGLFILSIATLFGIWFSQYLTRPVQVLFDATNEVAKGNFSNNISINARDEMGALSDSFNFMTKEILRYMEQMKEKARLEGEVAVARLVQSTYFPAEDNWQNNIEISGIFRPASECGGDWWVHVSIGKYKVVIIVDATGHGVPAALATATAHSTLVMLEKYFKEQKQMPSSSLILSTLNQILFKLQGSMMMTAWAGIIDPENNKLQYSNASHQPPVLIPALNNELTPLMDANAARLGHQLTTIYSEVTIDFCPGDNLILFTDGLLDIQNNDKKSYGMRKLKRMLTSEHLSMSAQGIKLKIMSDALTFKGNVPLGDDVTLIAIKYHQAIPLPVDNSSVHISDFDKYKNIQSLMGEWKHINHLIGANSPFIENEKKYCLQNMTINHIFGLERHLGAFDVMVHLKIQLGLDFNLQLMQALDKISYEDYFEGPRSYLELISNELIINALKHSPSGVIDYFLATSENGLGISVRDEGGVLTRDTILEKIDRGFREQTPEERKNGAGLGLYLAYNIANQIIFATVPSVATEVTVIIEPNKRYKKYKERITSIHFYEVNA